MADTDTITGAPSLGADYPAGAVHNGRESLRRLVAHHDFRSDGVPLAMCAEYDHAIRCFEAMVSALAGIAPPQELRVVFDGPPGIDGGRFVEVEDVGGNSLRAGEWHARPDGYHELRIAAPSSEALAQAVAAAREEADKTREALKLAMQLVQRCVGQGIAFEEDGPLPEMESWVVAESIAKTLGIGINSEEYVSLFTAPPTPAQTDTAPGGRADG